MMSNAIITGGTTGIGFGIAIAMVEAGYHVTVTGITDEQVAAVATSERLSAVKLDVTSAASVAAVLAPYDRLAALINCAGMIVRNYAEYDIETFQKVIDVNLTGTMRMCVAARPKLAAARGAIVNTASMLSFFGGAAVPAYTASKGGVAQLTKALGECDCPGLDRDRVNQRFGGGRGSVRRHSEPHTDAALGPAGRCRRCGSISLFRSSPLHHRSDLARRWRIRSSLRSEDLL
jgi:NAD(P)-dependent dehydrogenase (short-subunit alcohol dehydrogenase family)